MSVLTGGAAGGPFNIKTKAFADAVAAGLSEAGNAGIGSNVVQAVKTNTFTTSSGTFVALTGLSVTITPTSTSSRVLVLVSINGVSHSSTSGNPKGQFNIRRGGTNIGQPNVPGATMNLVQVPDAVSRSVSMVLLDSPGTTSPIVYDVTVSTGQTIRINRGGVTPVDCVSSIQAIEVAA